MSQDLQFSSLISYIEQNQYYGVKSLSSNRKLMGMKTKTGATPLIRACQFKNTSTEIIQCLFSAGSQLLTKDSRNKSPFLSACESGNLSVAVFLYSKCRNTEVLRFVVDCEKEDPLTKSVKSGNCDLLKWLLITEDREANKKRALYYSVMLGNIEMFKILMELKFESLDYDDLFVQCSSNPNLEIIQTLHPKCECLSPADYERLANRVQNNEKVKEELLKYSRMRTEELAWRFVKPAYLIRENGRKATCSNANLREHPLSNICDDAFYLVCSFLIKKPERTFHDGDDFFYISTFAADRIESPYCSSDDDFDYY